MRNKKKTKKTTTTEHQVFDIRQLILEGLLYLSMQYKLCSLLKAVRWHYSNIDL